MRHISFELWENRNHKRELPHSYAGYKLTSYNWSIFFLPYLFTVEKGVCILNTNVNSVTCALDTSLFLFPSFCSLCLLLYCLSTVSFSRHSDVFYYYLLSSCRKKILDPTLSVSCHLIFLLLCRSEHLVGIVYTCCLYFFPSNAFFDKLTSVFCFPISPKAAFVRVTEDGNVGKSCLSQSLHRVDRCGWLFPP